MEKEIVSEWPQLQFYFILFLVFPFFLSVSPVITMKALQLRVFHLRGGAGAGGGGGGGGDGSDGGGGGSGQDDNAEKKIVDQFDESSLVRPENVSGLWSHHDHAISHTCCVSEDRSVTTFQLIELIAYFFFSVRFFSVFGFYFLCGADFSRWDGG